MTLNKQIPEALRLAYWLERDGANCQMHLDAAAELRRLHAVNQELLAALKALEELFNPETPHSVKVWDKARYVIAKAEAGYL